MSRPNIVVVGGSYVGVNVAQQLASALHERFRIVLVEKNSHFQHLFAFPRFAVTTLVDTHKAFIPYAPGVFASSPAGAGVFVQAKVVDLTAQDILLDHEVELDGTKSNRITYEYLVIATGTKLAPPSSLPGQGKLDGTSYLRKHAARVERSSSVVVIGGGAVGVQMATDIKELYPEKSVTLVHSRTRVMHKFHENLHNIIAKRCADLGVAMKLGSRAKLPEDGYPTDGTTFDVKFEDGSSVPADFAIICTGQVPQSGILQTLCPQCINGDGFIITQKTLQLADDRYSHVFALGDVADTTAHKAAKPGAKQAALVVKNIQAFLKDEPLDEYVVTEPPGIHLTLGITQSVAFGNPTSPDVPPFTKHREDGRLDMNIDGIWARKAGGSDYYA